MDRLESRTFDDISVGDSASITRTLTHVDVQRFAIAFGGIDSVRLELWGCALIATVLAEKLPGAGSTCLAQNLRFRHPIRIGDSITACVTVAAKDAPTQRVTLDCRCTNHSGEVVVEGRVEVTAASVQSTPSSGTISPPRPANTEVRHRHVFELARGLEPLRTAVVHPVDRNSLLGAVDAARAGLIIPVLVGPEAKIRAVADVESVDLAHVLGIAIPRVAILSAVETPTPELKSTIDAAALCKMAERRQITGGLLDGPLAFDNAISEEAAKIKGIESAVAGRADILVVPDLESGNMLAKQLTSRADNPATRMASCAVALVFARRGPKY
jgi:phosphate acetyl/butyryl transferase